MSFEGGSPDLRLNTGKYGVCTCDNGEENLKRFELIISEDNTFQYFDNTNSNNIIDLKGSWIREKNTIYLKNFSSDIEIHSKWIIDDNEKCLKSRKGLNFMRLCHLGACK